MASDGVVSVTILTSLSPLGAPAVTVDGTILVFFRFPPLVLPSHLTPPCRIRVELELSLLPVLLHVLPFPTLQLSIEAHHG